MFVFVLLQNGREIFNFVLCEIFLEFRKISLNTKLKFWAKFSPFRETRNQNLGKVLAILQTTNDFFTVD